MIRMWNLSRFYIDINKLHIDNSNFFHLLQMKVIVRNMRNMRQIIFQKNIKCKKNYNYLLYKALKIKIYSF